MEYVHHCIPTHLTRRPSFENSLVDQLNYNGFHRMRSLFDEVISKEKDVRQNFHLVVDAGCGTGLAGEVVRNTFNFMILIQMIS